MTNDERLERLIRLDEALELFQVRVLFPDRYQPREPVRERFDQHDRHQHDRTPRQRTERR